MKCLLQFCLFFVLFTSRLCAPSTGHKNTIPIEKNIGKKAAKWALEAAKWPSPAEVAEWSKGLDGQVYFPGSWEYFNGTILQNKLYNSKFGVVAMVESTTDVQKCIQFCIKYGIRPTVKSGGHSFVGRSSADYSFSINMKRMNHVKLNENDPLSSTGISADIGPGITWGEVYRQLDGLGPYLVVGGNEASVAPGGYATGGGHSPMSRMFGLAVDNTIGFTLVTPEGNIIDMTEKGGAILKTGKTNWEPFNDPELFWAVRGGGGGTYGVVTSFKFVIHKAPESGFCLVVMHYPMYHPLYGLVTDKVINKFSDLLQYNLTKNWGGYVIYSGASWFENQQVHLPVKQDPWLKGHLLFILLHVGGCEEAESTKSLLENMYPKYRVTYFNQSHPTFWDYVKGGVVPKVYGRTYIVNRLIQAEDLKNDSEFVKTVVDLGETKETIACTWTTIGGKVGNPDRDSSVTPDFRTSFGSVSCGIEWAYEKDDDRMIKAVQEYAERMYKIGKGVYFNEPEYYLKNWKEEYWGSMERYNRLLEVKKKYDPDHMFMCHMCVGSDIEY